MEVIAAKDSVLVADIGSSSLKTALINKRGQVLAYARLAFLKRFTDFSALEWFDSLSASIKIIEDKLKEKKIPLEKVRGLCISGNGPTLVSEKGATLAWNEAASEKVAIQSLYLPRLLQFKKKFSSTYQETSHIFSGPEFLIYQLTKRALTILPEDRFLQAYWTEEEAIECGLSKNDLEKLPPFAKPAEQAGTITLEAAEKLNSPLICKDTPLFCGAPDFISALVGTGTLKAGRLCDRAGSSEGLNLCTSKAIKAEGIRTLPSIIPGLWNASVLFPTSGERFWAFKQKIERELGKELSFTDLVSALVQSDGSNPSLDQGKYLMLQTAMEIKEGIELLLNTAEKENAIPFKTDLMTVTGGQASNYDWNKMKADVTRMRIRTLSCSDSELLGDAVFAFTGLKDFASIQEGAEEILANENL